jgi:uncharacterized protein YdhG (YjbR/CyaY superfamily)
MAKTDFNSVNEYLASQPRASRALLTRVRNAIRKAIPAAEEVISYQIPAYKLHGRGVISFAGWKEHFSIYPANARLVAAFKDELKPYEVNNKGTVRFPLSEPVPVKLIADLAKFRAKEVTETTRAKTAASTKRGGSTKR